MADKDYGLYVHGEPYLGPKGEGYQKTYERWIASKMSYYRSNGVFTELGTVNGYQVGVKGVTEEAMDILLGPGAGPGANLDSQLVLSEASVKSLIASAEENASLSSWDSWFASNEDALQSVSAKEWNEIQNIFEKTKSGMTEEYLKEKLGDEEFMKNQGGASLLNDSPYHKAVRNGTYLPNRVAGNIMDEYQTPMSVSYTHLRAHETS